MLVHRATLSNAHTSNQRASDSDSSTANIAKPKRNLHMYKHKHINEEDQTNNALDKETQNARRGGEKGRHRTKATKGSPKSFYHMVNGTLPSTGEPMDNNATDIATEIDTDMEMNMNNDITGESYTLLVFPTVLSRLNEMFATTYSSKYWSQISCNRMVLITSLI